MKEQFSDALQGKKIPILTLDNKWYRLLDEEARYALSGLETQLNDLLKRQGRLNTETKELRHLKKKLMQEIMSMAAQAEKSGDSKMDRLLEQHRDKVEECNRQLAEYQDELLELPREIDRVNNELMLATMEHCYNVMQENTDEILEIEEWVTQVRIDLKKRLVKKQEMERKNHELYSYMHDVFGVEVLELFDMKYNPEEKHPSTSEKKK